MKLLQRLFLAMVVLVAGTVSIIAHPAAVQAADTGWLSPNANAADTGGDNNGFEVNPTNAYADDSNSAQNIDGAGDRHRFYNYGIVLPMDNKVAGIEVRLDWWLESTSGTNTMSVDLSWDGGTSWTTAKSTSGESTSQRTDTLGGTADTWGHTWTATDLNDANFLVRLTCNSGTSTRDFSLDWAPIRITYNESIPPTVTIDQEVTQADPANSIPVNFTVVFNEPVSDFTGADVTVGGTAPGTKTASVTGSGTTYNVAISGMTNSGTVTASLAPGVAHDAAGNGNLASTGTDNEITYTDITGPSVTINKATGQADPTRISPVNFAVVFSEAVINFADGDVTLSGTAGATTATVTGSGTTYNVAVSGMTGSGTVIAEIISGAATDAAGNPNIASTSTDNSVDYDITAPAVTIDQGATQADPTSTMPVNFTVVFSKTVTGFTSSDITLGGTAPGTKIATVTGSGTTYNVAVSGMAGSGTVNATIAAGVATDAVGNGNLASTSTDNEVTYGDTVAPAVTINQASGQTDPTRASPINFTAVFSKPVTDFATGDVTLSGTAGATTATVTGSGTTYTVSVIGMTTDGTVIASIQAGVAHDISGNPNTASTSTDNTVTCDITDPAVTINQAAGQNDPTTTSPVNFVVVFNENVTGFTGTDVTFGGTAPGTKIATVTGSGTTYNVAVTGMTSSGTVNATIAAGVATDSVGNGNLASTSTDNEVTYTDITGPTVTINQATGQSDPADTTPVNFSVVFSEVVTDFGDGDVTLSGTAGATTATVTGSGTTYNVAVAGLAGPGMVIVDIPAGVAHDVAGNPSAASTSTDNTVTYVISTGGNVPGAWRAYSGTVTNPQNAQTSDNQYAVFDSDTDVEDYYDFGFNIPAGAIINGIQASFEGKRDSGSTPRVFSVTLSWDNGTTWSTAVSGIDLTTTEGTKTAGSATNLWGTHPWVPADFNNGALVMRIDPISANGNLNIDQVLLKVYYTPGAEYTLAVTTVGSGTVTRTPDQPTYPANTDVQLTATPGEGMAFYGWSGDLTGNANPSNITMTGNKTVTATFGPPLAVTTDSATALATIGATLNGNLISIGDLPGVSVYFQWGNDTGYGQQTAPIAMNATGVFSTAISGLNPKSAYHFRAVANDTSTVYGNDQTFTTLSIAPTVTTQAATSVTVSTAVLNGNLTGLGTNTTGVSVYFQWGPTTAMVNSTPPQTANVTGVFNAPVVNLPSNTTYYFLAVAAGDGTVYGGNLTFTTTSAPLGVSSSAATNIISTSATLNGNLTGLGSATSVNVSFQYGLTTSYGTNTTAELRSAAGLFNSTITGLTANRTYHYRARVVSGSTTVNGSDLQFTTTTTSPPVVTTVAASAVNISTATLNGNLTSKGSAANVNLSFQWGTTTAMNVTTTPQTVNATGTFNALLTGLTANTTYYYRAVAAGDGTGYGSNLTFTTLASAVINPPAVTSLAASGLTYNSAVLNGNLTSLGSASNVQVLFEYGTGTAYGLVTLPAIKNAAGTFNYTVTGLCGNTTYHVRAKATGDGAALGPDIIFTTPTDTTPGPAWWNTAFTRRAPITVTENSNTALTDYQVRVNVPFDADMQPDFSDVRFVDADGITALAYWRNSFTPSGLAVFWVKVPSLTALGTRTIFIYYGNPLATTTSNIHTTFIWGDDFDDVIWTGNNIHQVNYANSTGAMPTQFIDNGTYHQQGGAASEPIAEIFENGTLKTFPANYTAEVDFKAVNLAGGPFINPRYTGVDNKYENMIDLEWNNAVLNKVVGDVWYNLGATTLGYTVNNATWYKLGAVAIQENSTTTRLKVLCNDILFINVPDNSLNYPARPGLAFLTYDMENAFHCSYDNYRVRKWAEVEPGAVIGAEKSFGAVSTGAVTNTANTSVMLNGSIDNLGGAAGMQVSFEYGPAGTAYGFNTPAQNMAIAAPYNATITGLTPNTSYHVRAKGIGNGVIYGNDTAFTTSPSNFIRAMSPRILKGQIFQVTVNFTALANDFNSIGLTDYVPAGWTVTANDTACTPALMSSSVVGNRISYIWSGPYTSGTPFTAVYQVTAPTGAATASYPFSGTLEWRIGGGTPASDAIDGLTQVQVVDGGTIIGTTYEVSGNVLTAVTATMDGNVTNVSDGTGNYTLATMVLGTHSIVGSKLGFRPLTQTLNVTDVAGLYVLDFKGNNALIPNAPNVSYVLACINKWKFPPSDGTGLSVSKVLAVINAWKFPL